VKNQECNSLHISRHIQGSKIYSFSIHLLYSNRFTLFVDTNKPQGLVISIDREFIEKIDGAHIFSFSDINDKLTIEKVNKVLNGRQANSVISDMVMKKINLD
jgi:hypothetical protein